MACVQLYYLNISVLLLNFSVCVNSRILSEDNRYAIKIITRDEWQAAPATNQHPLNLPVPYVVVHHTYIPAACFTQEQCAKDMRSMQKYHQSLNWGDIGYNFCIGAEGSAFEGRGWNIKGIHAGRANNYSIGICMIGDWREELPPESSMETLIGLIKEGVNLGKIREDYKLIGHMQAMATECPGETLMEEISTWKHFAPGKPDFDHIAD